MDKIKLTLTLNQLAWLLNEQKRITVEKCLSHNYIYNLESTESQVKSLPIDVEKFKDHGMNAAFPKDFEVLVKYLGDL